MEEYSEIFIMLLFIVICYVSYLLYNGTINTTDQYIINTENSWYFSNSIKKEGDCLVLDSGHICGTYAVGNNPNYKGVK
jgi:hypothetical protein